MGYFSELDFTQCEDMAWSNPTKVQQLSDEIHYLNERILDLEEQCPRDMSDHKFDQMFYSECLEGSCEDSDTIQGVLQSIRKTEDLLRIAEEEEQRKLDEKQQRMEWRNTILETGATPDSQIVLLGVFFPVADHSVAA